MQQSLPISLLQGDRVDNQTDYIDALPVNVSGVLKDILGSKGYILEQPGLTQYGTVSTDGPPIVPYLFSRGGIWNERENNLFRVSDNGFFEVDADGVTNLLGTIAGSGQVSLPYSFNTQAIIGGGNYYLYDSVNGFRQVNDSDLGRPIDATWIDGYYFFTDGEFVYHTDIDNESQIDPLKFATSEFSPDPTLGVGITVDNKVIAFNRYTADFFQNQANEFFAFSILKGRSLNAGIVGTYAKVRIDFPTQYGSGTWFCLGGGKDAENTVYAMNTGATQSISSRTVNKIINSYTDAQLSETVLESRNVEEYTYLLVHLPSHVLLFNFRVAEALGVEKAWSVLVSDAAGQVPYRAINGVYDPRRAQWTYGDKYLDYLTYLDMTSSEQAGEKVECVMYTPFTYLETASIDELMIQTIPGFTTTPDATVFVSLTYNGVTWTQEYSMPYGLPSEYNLRFILRRLGFVRNYFALKFRWVSKSRMAFATANILYS